MNIVGIINHEVLKRSRGHVVKLLKALGTAVRRSAALPGQVMLEAEDVAQACGLEMAAITIGWLIGKKKQRRRQSHRQP